VLRAAKAQAPGGGNEKILRLPLGPLGFFLASFTDAIPRQFFTKGNIMSDSKKPAAKVSLFPVSAAIWRNQSQKGDVYYSVTFERSFKDDKGKWQSTDRFNAGDMLLVSKLADLADTEIRQLRTNDKQQSEDEAA
jgi:hypothetical protein